MGPSLGMSLSQTMSLRQELSLQQRHLLLQTHLLSQRLALIQVLHGDTYEPSGRCPQCSRQLTPLEILKGFNQDPTDFTTECTGCHNRFAPKLICFGSIARIELPFYCELQALDQLRGFATSPPEEIAHKIPAVYRSLIVHCGSLKAAFKRNGVEYTLEKKVDWRNKIHPFLGQLPDTVIADVCGVTVRKVRSLRKELKVPPYVESEIVEELAEDLE